MAEMGNAWMKKISCDPPILYQIRTVTIDKAVISSTPKTIELEFTDVKKVVVSVYDMIPSTYSDENITYVEIDGNVFADGDGTVASDIFMDRHDYKGNTGEDLIQHLFTFYCKNKVKLKVGNPSTSSTLTITYALYH